MCLIVKLLLPSAAYPNLTIGSICRYVIRSIASDLGTPQRNSSLYFITINVLRNRFAPHFVNAPYSAEVDRNAAVNSNFAQVFARDRDTISPFNQVTLEVIGDGAATGFFGVRSNGAIFVRNSLTGAPNSEYT